mmetsp:Transcript_125761/g.245187  ORF Transcript_125761/g.245187 Transcript_125761/m.245187 type:complete len:591 (-) Transcript_125761:233-2005(-)|eukprot:CAMPEP_0172737754 /NCGR_PEP_ID=MMETSP1074-20121228/118512_1 /TAXON_ID=2916 /ORGANISM="Ceratium fusus, Strain PA161109" /LENGTH=590 /DNA_ID=CAMNT_0013567233 /DNA_START=1 /DNA_END=1773 /DNA_ORIENTATION=+
MASRARWAALLSYAFFLLLSLSVTLWLQSVPRAPLPREEIAALRHDLSAGDEGDGLETVPWPRARIIFAAAPGSDLVASGELEKLRQHLAAYLDGKEHATVELASGAHSLQQGLSACAMVGSGTSETNVKACLAALEEQTPASADTALTNTFEVMVVPVTGGSGCSTLQLGTGRNAVLHWRREGALASTEGLSKALGRQLRRTWLLRTKLDPTAALFEVAPAYVFSYYLVGDCQQRVAWDFLEVLRKPFLAQLLARLRLLVDIEEESQVVQCGSLGGRSSSGGETINEATLHAEFLRHAGEWPGDAITRDAIWLPPLLRFAAFKPSTPLRVVDAQRRPQSSFAMQGWGTVAILNTSSTLYGENVDAAQNLSGLPINASFVTKTEAQQAASAWVSNVRSWLTLPPDNPMKADANDCTDGSLAVQAARPHFAGIADWELLLVARAFHGFFIARALEVLEKLVALIDSLPDVVVREEIGGFAMEAASAIRRSVVAASQGDIVGAMRDARRGLKLALTVQQDDTVVAATYFSWEFKYAVYLPLFLPISIPVLVALIRQTKQARKRHRFRLAATAGTTSSTTEGAAAASGDLHIE